MQDEINTQTDAVPLFSTLPLLSGLFKNRNDASGKTELVIFIRPTVLTQELHENAFEGTNAAWTSGEFFKSGNAIRKIADPNLAKGHTP